MYSMIIDSIILFNDIIVYPYNTVHIYILYVFFEKPFIFSHKIRFTYYGIEVN